MHPPLPNEIWTRILSIARSEQDLPEAWLSHRFVSRAFKTAVETVFRDQHLRKTWITLQLGTLFEGEDSPVPLDADFEFSHLSEDKKLAHFKLDPLGKKYNDEITARLRTFPKDAIEKPQHYVQIHRELNDTPIPSLSISPSDHTLSCDWRGLYTRYFAEEILYTKYTNEWVKSQEEWMNSVQVKVARGELDMGAVLEQAIHGYGNNADVTRRRVRKARMKRQWAERGVARDEDEEDKASENKRMKRMGTARQIANMVEDSDFDDDEEGSDEDEEEDDEDSEGDGWETDDSGGDDEDEVVEDSDDDGPVVHT